MKNLIILCILAFAPAAIYAQDTKAQGILDKLSTKIKGQKSFYVEFSANITNSSTGRNETVTGKGWVKGNKFYASYGDNTIISNGVKTWTVTKAEKQTYVTDADEEDSESMNPKKLLTIWESGFKNKYEKEEKLGDETVHMIYLYPKNAKGAKYHTIVLYIAKSDNELKKAILKSNDGTRMTYTLTKFTSNPLVEDSKFVYDPAKYPGYELVED